MKVTCDDETSAAKLPLLETNVTEIIAVVTGDIPTGFREISGLPKKAYNE